MIAIQSYFDNNKLLLSSLSSMNAEELLKEATKLKNDSETPKTSKVKMEPETPKSSKVFFQPDITLGLLKEEGIYSSSRRSSSSTVFQIMLQSHSYTGLTVSNLLPLFMMFLELKHLFFRKQVLLMLAFHFVTIQNDYFQRANGCRVFPSVLHQL